MNNVIILNIMYQGGYLLEGENIGHEIINLTRADDGKYYVWLNSMGTFNNSLYNKAHKDMLMIRHVSKGLYKIIGKATDCIVADGASLTGIDNQQQRYEIQEKLGITYNGVKLEDIFKENKYNNSNDDQNTLVTFLANEVREPKRDLYITNDENLVIENKVFYCDFKGRQTLRMYIPENNKSFVNINSLLHNDSLWKDTTVEYLVDGFDNYTTAVNFFDILKKDKDEVAFSNAIYYFLLDNSLVGSFLHYLDNDIDEAEEFTVFRERNNIDLLFMGKKHVCIIENKIDSGINGQTDKTLKDQILAVTKNFMKKQIEEDYSNHDEKESGIDNRIKDIKQILNKVIDSNGEEEKQRSQLSKYYIYALNYALDNGFENPGDQIKAFVLCPNYSKFMYGTDPNGYILSKYTLSEKYKLLTYSYLHEFFEKASFESRYRDDFISGIKNLSKEFDDRLETEMKARFAKRVKSLKCLSKHFV